MMDLFVVDNEKCKRDNICVEECPARIILMKDKNSPPVPVNHAEEYCIRCGHCVAVCPYGALSHKAMTPDECPPVQEELLLSPEHIEHVLRSRSPFAPTEKRPWTGKRSPG